MLTVGITGGIGCGKSAVTEYLAQHDITIVDADVAARVVVEPESPALQEIAQHFGAQVIQPDGTLDRKFLRSLIFSNDTERQWLESLLHPLIGKQILHQLQQASSPYAVLVSPLLLETHQHQWVDRVLVVDVPEAIQIERTLLRDQTNEQQVKAIMAAQAKRKDRLAQADDIIDNSKDLPHLHNQLALMHQHYLELAAVPMIKPAHNHGEKPQAQTPLEPRSLNVRKSTEGNSHES